MAKTRNKTKHPWVTMAVICENVLEEKDNVLSVIRAFDRLNVPRPTEWDGKTNLHFPLKGIVAFKSGDVKGSRKVTIYGTSPKGKRRKLFELSPEFLGGDNGVNIKLNMLFGFRTQGTHWIEVYVEKWHAARIPITIVFQETKPDEPAAGKSPARG